MRPAVVIATCRQESITRWFDAWRQDLKDTTSVIVVEDNPTVTFDLPVEGYTHVEHYAWDDIDHRLGSNSWIIPRRTSAIKSFGFLRAFQLGFDAVWTLDDDCFPEWKNQGEYLRTLSLIMERTEFVDDTRWFNTIRDTNLYPRGYPYDVRNRPVVHHGLWSHVPDLDGVTALKYPDFRTDPADGIELVPFGKFFPMCGMNLVFTREMLPAMYFMLQGHMYKDGELTKLPYDRFDDIWAGLFAKKITDHLSLPMTTGYPSIVHTKESDPQERVIKEAPGIIANDKLWHLIDRMSLSGCTTVADCYRVLAGCVDWWADDLPNPEYWHKLSDAMQIWTELSA